MSSDELKILCCASSRMSEKTRGVKDERKTTTTTFAYKECVIFYPLLDMLCLLVRRNSDPSQDVLSRKPQKNKHTICQSSPIVPNRLLRTQTKKRKQHGIGFGVVVFCWRSQTCSNPSPAKYQNNSEKEWRKFRTDAWYLQVLSHSRLFLSRRIFRASRWENLKKIHVCGFMGQIQREERRKTEKHIQPSREREREREREKERNWKRKLIRVKKLMRAKRARMKGRQGMRHGEKTKWWRRKGRGRKSRNVEWIGAIMVIFTSLWNTTEVRQSDIWPVFW